MEDGVPPAAVQTRASGFLVSGFGFQRSGTGLAPETRTLKPQTPETRSQELGSRCRATCPVCFRARCFTRHPARDRLVPVTGSSHIVRRATLDDLAVLRGLWSTARWPAFELEPRLTQFQIAFRPDETAVGAIGLHVAGWDALLHSPSFYSAAEETAALPVLWEHLQSVARGKRLARFWIAGPVGEFWELAGFAPASPTDLKRLPPAFKKPTEQAQWWTFALRDDAAIEQFLEKEFPKLREEGRKDTDRLRRQARLWKWIGGLLATGVFFGVLWLLIQVIGSMGQRGVLR